MHYFQAGLKLQREIGNVKDISNTLNNIGQIYWRCKYYELALEAYQEALVIANRTGARDTEATILGYFMRAWMTIKKP